MSRFPNLAKNQKNKSIIDVILEGGSLSLNIIQGVADTTGAPFVSQAASLLLQLFEIIQVGILILSRHSPKLSKTHAEVSFGRQ